MTVQAIRSHRSATHKRKFWRWLGIGVAAFLVVALIAARLYLGVWALNYVNNVLHRIKGYDGSVESINVDLYRGAYRINKLVLNKKEGKIPTPFLAIDVVDFSVQWKALLHGRIVSDADLLHPTLNFAVKNDSAQTGEGVDWTKPIKALSPVDINHVNLHDGTIAYRDFSSNPNVNIYLHHMNGYVRNLRNIENPSDPLPSSLDISGDSIGNGRLNIQGKMNILKDVPDMNLTTKLETVQLPALNSYTDAYAAFTFSGGVCDFYSQLNIKDKKVSGYVRFLMHDIAVDVVNSPNPLQDVWSAIVAGLITIFTNQSHDQFATQAELAGTLDDIHTNIWSILGSIFHNAFIDALKRGFDTSGHGDLLKDEKK